MKRVLLILTVGIFLSSCSNPSQSLQTGKDWPTYGGNKAGNRYSPLDQINKENVNKLQVAWMYDASEPYDTTAPGPRRVKAIQTQPIVVNGILYGLTPELTLFALKAGTGEEIWRFHPVADNQTFSTNRGVAYWENGDDKRILYTVGSNLYSVNIKDGTVVSSFGNNGMVSLREGLQTNQTRDVNQLSVSASTPGVIYKNTYVIGSSVSEAGDAAPGHIRAF